MTTAFEFAVRDRSNQFFRTSASMPNRNSTRGSAGQWRSEPRLAKFARIGAGDITSRTARERSGVEDYFEKGITIRHSDVGGKSEIGDNTEAGHATSDKTRLASNSFFSIATVAANEPLPSNFSPLYTHVGQSPLIRSPWFKGQATKIAIETRPSEINKVRILPENEKRLEDSISRPSFNADTVAQNESVAVPTPTVDKLNCLMPSDRIHKPMTSGAIVRFRAAGAVNAGISAEKMAPRPGSQKIADISPVVQNHNRERHVKAPNLSHGSNATPGELSKGEPSFTGSPDRISTRNDNLPVPQSSSIAGELWLDTISLRDWLQKYLTAEFKHAQRTTNLAASSFAGM